MTPEEPRVDPLAPPAHDDRDVRRVTLGTAVLLLPLAGCGGAGSSGYSESALAACLRQHGAHVIPSSSAFPSQGYVTRGDVTRTLGTPNWFVAKLPADGFEIFGFAASASEASKSAARAKSTFFAGFVGSKGNMVLLGRHPSEQKVISGCEENAKRT